MLLTTSTREAPSLSRIVVPGAAGLDLRLQHWADGRHLDVERLVADRGHGDDRRSGGGFAAALQNLTDHTGAVTEPSTAKMIGCPTTGVDLQRGHTPVRMALLAVASLALAVLVGLAPATITRHHHLPATSAGGRKRDHRVRRRRLVALAVGSQAARCPGSTGAACLLCSAYRGCDGCRWVPPSPGSHAGSALALGPAL